MKHRAESLVAIAAGAAIAGLAARERSNLRETFRATIDISDRANRSRCSVAYGTSTWRLDDRLPAGWVGRQSGTMRTDGDTATFIADDGTRVKFRRSGGTSDDFLW